MSYDYAADMRALATLREEHSVVVQGNVTWTWSCSCGKAGEPTTQGRASAGRDQHLTAERKKIAQRQAKESHG